MIDRGKFFKILRESRTAMFGAALSQGQVNGIEAILDAFETHGDGRSKSLAYCLATARHEVGHNMTPVREGFKATDIEARSFVARCYGHKGRAWYCWPAGPYGHVYYGRGLVQLTWLDNYAKSSGDAGVDLVKYPDKALDPLIAGRLLVRGVIDGRWNGHGKGIGFYLPTSGPDDLMNARRTVNITDKWETIAAYYREFLGAIYQSKVETPPAPVNPWLVLFNAIFGGRK